MKLKLAIQTSNFKSNCRTHSNLMIILISELRTGELWWKTIESIIKTMCFYMDRKPCMHSESTAVYNTHYLNLSPQFLARTHGGCVA